MARKLILTLVGLALVVGGLVYAKLGQFQAMGEAAKQMVMPPTTVTAMTLAPAQWERRVEATATVTAVQGVMIGAELGGRVSAIAFESGQSVAAGDVLLRLDTSSEEAQLAAAKASAALARADLARIRKLARRKLTSADTIDRAEAEVKKTVAQIGVIQAAIDKKTVRAPFAGRLGLRQVDLGQILREGDPIVTLQTLDPVYVDFSVPQAQLKRIAPGMPVRFTTDAVPDHPFRGEVIAVSPEVDSRTRTVRIRARVSNPDESLRAGMFGEAAVVLPERQPVLPVLATAVLYAPYGDSIFIIEPSKGTGAEEEQLTLRQQFVRLGQAHGDFIDLVEGARAGEQVVTSGVFKLRSGMPVVIDNQLAPKGELDPSPDDS